MNPNINWDKEKVSPREAQIIFAMLMMDMRIAASLLRDKGGDPEAPEFAVKIANRSVEFMNLMFPDLNFRVG